MQPPSATHKPLSEAVKFCNSSGDMIDGIPFVYPIEAEWRISTSVN